MRFYFYLLVSVILHLTLIGGSQWLKNDVPAPATHQFEVRLVAPEPVPPLVQSTELSVPEAPPEVIPPEAPPTPASPLKSTHAVAPQELRGAALQRAQGALSSHLLYPPEAIRLGLEGDVMLLLKLDSGGNIRSIAIARSSGHVLLDQAAISAAGNIGALPGNKAETLLPVSFRLQ